MFEYQKNNKFFAQVISTMEELCKDELIELGAKNATAAYRGVYFEADKKTLYKINYCSRLASRVLAPLGNFKARSGKDITAEALKIKWDEIFPVDKTFAITSAVNNSEINNSLYASQALKDGIADYFRNKLGKRPNVDVKNPDVRFNLFIEKNQAILSLDTSGESLHKRGYRLLAGEAPMQETVAAAIVKLSGWNGEKPLWDPMCGSGTLLCEAMMHYCKVPAQYLRKHFGFFNLPDFDKTIWEGVKIESDKNIRSLPKGIISGSDKSQRMIKVAEENLSYLPYHKEVYLSGQPFQHIAEFNDGVIITNPPYGIRLGEIEEAKSLFKEFGDFIKTKCHGTSAFIYSGDPELRKSIGLKTSKRIPLSNGKLKGVLFQIDSYEGTKKKKWEND